MRVCVARARSSVLFVHQLWKQQIVADIISETPIQQRFLRNQRHEIEEIKKYGIGEEEEEGEELDINMKYSEARK